MNRVDAALAGLVVASLGISIAVWAPFLLPPRVDVHLDADVAPRPAVQRIQPSATPGTPWWTPTPGPTGKPTAETDWAAEARKSDLERNRIYDAGRLPAVNCVLPSAALVSKVAMDKYVRAIMACLDKAWLPLIERAGHYFQPAALHLVKRNSSGPCGKADATAYYCSRDQGIYIDAAVYLDSFRQEWKRAALLSTVSHEYGHHVQRMAGILTSNPEYTQKGAAALESSRRLEIQASCFGTAFLGANQESLKLRGERLRLLNIGVGGDEDFPDTPRDHGSRKSVKFWEPAGFKSQNPGSCNTWAAPAAKVS
jgi:hypothetical protein